MTRAEAAPDAARPLRIGVSGAGGAQGAGADDAALAAARVVGETIARAGAVLVTGGLGGVMEAAARGAAEAGGMTVGILPGERAGDANPWIAIPVVTDLGHARNVILVHTAEALVAVGGSYGTLSEIALALKIGVPVAAVGSWKVERAGHAAPPIATFDDPKAAANWALEAARRARGSRER
jgi:uncharacterized protein (TIGR00725 family)